MLLVGANIAREKTAAQYKESNKKVFEQSYLDKINSMGEDNLYGICGNTNRIDVWQMYNLSAVWLLRGIMVYYIVMMIKLLRMFIKNLQEKDESDFYKVTGGDAK